MNTRTLENFIENIRDFTLQTENCREKLLYSVDDILKVLVDDQKLYSLIGGYTDMLKILENLSSKTEGLLENDIPYDQKEINSFVSSYLLKYKETELGRHDLFGELVRKKLHFVPPSRDSCDMKDAILSYIDFCHENKEIKNHIDDPEKIKESLTLNLATPDNFVIFKESKGENACLMIYDWKVSVNTQTEMKTSENYYNNIWKTFKDLKYNGKPFLESFPIYICIIILKPMSQMTVTVTLSKVEKKFNESEYNSFQERKQHAKKAKICQVNYLTDLVKGNNLNAYYSETQLLKTILSERLPDWEDQNDIFFSNWCQDYRTTSLDNNLMSKDIYKMIDCIKTENFTKEEICHYIFGSFIWHLGSMNELHIQDKFSGYIRNCEFMGVKPYRSLHLLEDYIKKNNGKWEELYDNHLVKIKELVIEKKSKETLVSSIDEAFEKNSVLYEIDYPDCFTSDLSSTKTNFSIPWSPSTIFYKETHMDYNNTVIQNFRNCFSSEHHLIHNDPYKLGKYDKSLSINIYNLVKTCMVDLSCDTSNTGKILLEDVIDIKDGSISVAREEKTNDWFKTSNGVVYRNGNEFSLGENISSRSTFYTGLRTMKVNMGKREKALEKKKKLVKIQQKKEYDTSENGPSNLKSIGSITHNKNLIKYNNTEAFSWSEMISKNYFALSYFDRRQKTKIEEVYNFYNENNGKLFSSNKLLDLELTNNKKIHEVCKTLSVYSFSDDMMQFSKGLMVADRYMKEKDFKILTCSNQNMIILAFKGDGLNTGKSGVPYVVLNLVPEDLQNNFATTYTKELLCFFKKDKFYLNIMRPQRLNQVRLLSLFKTPSKLPICFSQYILKSTEVMSYLETVPLQDINILTMPGSVKEHLKNILFSSSIISTVTKLGRMGIFDFMRYAGFLPLSDYSNVKNYILEKFDPDINNVVDIFFVNGIIKLLNHMEGITLSSSINPLTIDQEEDMSGGIKNLNIKCPITNSTLKTIEDLYNNVYLAIYLMPKSLHTHVHNLTSLLNVPAEWEIKFRNKMGFSMFEEVYPKESMFDNSGPFSIDGTLNLVSLSDYYRRTIENVSLTRSNVENKEGFLLPGYKISTLSSSKKCSKSEIITDETIYDFLNKENLSLENFKENEMYIFKGVVKSYLEDPKSVQDFLNLGCKRSIYIFEFIKKQCDGENLKKMKLSNNKFYQLSHPLTVETYLKIRYSKMSPATVLKSKKVSEELYDIIKEYNKITETDLKNLENLEGGINGQKHSYMQLLEFIMLKTKNNMNHTDFLVSVFEKMQRTKTDREIYLMSMKVKMMLYFLEHTYKHIAQNDPSEAISISGDYKIKTLSKLSMETITTYNSLLNKGSDVKIAFLSADQSKWSASDLTYKYVLAILMNPLLTTGECNLMCECLMMYVKFKRVCIPTDIFINLKQSQDYFGITTNSLSVLTNNLETNCYPVTMNWLQGNLNYLSSVYHSCAMQCYDKTLSRMKDYKFFVKWIVHSDDNATSLVAEGNIPNLLKEFKCQNLSEFIFRTIESHFPSFCITLNPKKSYASESEVEFISERIINGAVIPLYCRHLANCCTESSHISYFGDLMSLSIHITMLLRKGCPTELIPFSYAAVQVQSLSIYSMLPGEENDSFKIIKEINFPLSNTELPTCAGGWMTAPVEMLSTLGPSVNDQIIYYNILKDFLGKKDFESLKESSLDEIFVDKRAEEFSKKQKNNCLNVTDMKMKCLLNIFKASLLTENQDSLEIGVKFQTMVSQIIQLPSYVNENALNSLSSFKDFCKLYPHLKKNSSLLKSLSENKPDEFDIDIDIEKELATDEMKEVYDRMIKNPETFLIAPLNDRDYILNQIFTYSSLSKRYQLSNQSTEKLALDRILRSKARTFIDPISMKKLTYKENITNKLKSIKTDHVDIYGLLRITLDLVLKDLNFETSMSLLDSLLPSISIPKLNYNFRWYIPEKLPPIIEGSPGLIVMTGCYGTDYVQSLGLKNLPLDSDSIYLLHDIFGNFLKYEDVVTIAQNKERSFESEDFIKADEFKRKVIAVNYMIQSQNRLLSIGTCFNRKSFPFYSKYNMGKNVVTNTLSLWGTIYSRRNNIYFYSQMKFNINKSNRLIMKNSRDVNLSQIIDTAVYISDKLQSLFPDLKIQEIATILKNLEYSGVCLHDLILNQLHSVKNAINNVRTASHVVLSHRSKLLVMSKYLSWLYNFDYITEKEFNYINRHIRRQEVTYIRTEEQDSFGNYFSGQNYKIGFMNNSNYSFLFYINDVLSINCMTPYEIKSDTGLYLETHKNSILKLLTKFIFDKHDIIKSNYSKSGIIYPGQYCIRISSSGKLIPYVNSGLKPDQIDNIKLSGKVNWTYVSELTWNIMHESKNMSLRKPATGESYNMTYKKIDQINEMHYNLIEKFKSGLLFRSEIKDLEEEINSFENHDQREYLKEFLEEVKLIAFEGLENCKSLQEYQDYLEENAFSSIVEMHKDFLALLEQEESDSGKEYINSVINKLMMYKESVGSFTNVCSMIKYSMINEITGNRIPKPTGKDFYFINCMKPIICDGFWLFGLLKLIKAAEVSYNNNSVLNLKIFNEVKPSKYYSKNSVIWINAHYDVSNDIMQETYDYKTITLNDIPITDSVRAILDEEGFKISGQVLSVSDKFETKIDDPFQDDLLTFEEISKKMKIVTKKPAHLIPSNTLLIGELIKFYMLSIDGEIYDLEEMLRLQFQLPTSSINRMQKIARNIPALRAHGYILNHYENEINPLSDIAFCLEGFLKMINIDIANSQVLDIISLLKKIQTEKDRTRCFSMLSKLKEYLSKNPLCLSESCMYSNFTYKELVVFTLRSKECLDSIIRKNIDMDDSSLIQELNFYLNEKQ
nr:RNA dependent RNA polymerase RdRp [Pterostylis blotch virus]